MEQGTLRPGDRLPTVRQLSDSLGVSGATVSAAYAFLADQGCTRGEVGRGTFVADARADAASPDREGHSTSRSPFPLQGGRGWRAGAMSTAAARIRATSAPQGTIDCASATPDIGLLPTKLVKRALRQVGQQLEPEELQYASPVCSPRLAGPVLALLAADGIHATESELVVASNAMQMLELALRSLPSTDETPVVGVEDPGYPLAFDLVERIGGRVIEIEVDRHGAVPESVRSAAEQGTRLILLTPRAQSPTGFSWTQERAAQLADVAREHPAVILVEDDHFAALSDTPCLSLRRVPELGRQIVHMRSFSKAIAPDLRVAVAAAPPHLARRMHESKLAADGWTSRILQRVLANVLEAPELASVLRSAALEYKQRREALALALSGLVASGVLDEVTPAADGLSVLVRLPGAVDSGELADEAARHGLLVMPAAAFHNRPGKNSMLRLALGVMRPGEGPEIASRLAAALGATSSTAPLTHAV